MLTLICLIGASVATIGFSLAIFTKDARVGKEIHARQIATLESLATETESATRRAAYLAKADALRAMGPTLATQSRGRV